MTTVVAMAAATAFFLSTGTRPSPLRCPQVRLRPRAPDARPGARQGGNAGAGRVRIPRAPDPPAVALEPLATGSVKAPAPGPRTPAPTPGPRCLPRRRPMPGAPKPFRRRPRPRGRGDASAASGHRDAAGQDGRRASKGARSRPDSEVAAPALRPWAAGPLERPPRGATSGNGVFVATKLGRRSAGGTQRGGWRGGGSGPPASPPG